MNNQVTTASIRRPTWQSCVMSAWWASAGLSSLWMIGWHLLCNAWVTEHVPTPQHKRLLLLARCLCALAATALWPFEAFQADGTCFSLVMLCSQCCLVTSECIQLDCKVLQVGEAGAVAYTLCVHDVPLLYHSRVCSSCIKSSSCYDLSLTLSLA